MEDVLDVYQKPYDKNYPVVCMDESSKQLHKGKLANIATKPGSSVRSAPFSSGGGHKYYHSF
ncbi:hypothetical protein AB835_12615 [Candidatus Endobugula sertula]|uniref:Tc1-like transposase DDE domain-containing protein n=1 Tax=Candidatus Endobugula sertula TaxID=62101 RepID=A0A1D2QMD4_9GAMM|nr:hypothetical protein AB835_12615 [Candidatus Endobugula sertula]